MLDLRTERIKRAQLQVSGADSLHDVVASDPATPGTRPHCPLCGVPRGTPVPAPLPPATAYWREMAGAQEERADGYIAEMFLLRDEIKRLEKQLAWALKGRDRAA